MIQPVAVMRQFKTKQLFRRHLLILALQPNLYKELKMQNHLFLIKVSRSLSLKLVAKNQRNSQMNTIKNPTEDLTAQTYDKNYRLIRISILKILKRLKSNTWSSLQQKICQKFAMIKKKNLSNSKSVNIARFQTRSSRKV